LIQNSEELLAPLAGSERFLTVSCGHTAAYFRAVLANAKTPEGGTLSATTSNDDMVFHSLLEKGWQWVIITAAVELQFPRLPFIAQQALNASNNASSQMSELEVACTLAEHVMHGLSWQETEKAVLTCNPPCAEYILTISRYVQKFGGGSDASMIRYLDEFAKKFGENIKLGAEFFTAVTDVSFGGANVFPHLRTALLSTNLCSRKVVDGVARFITKTDVERLKSQKMASMVQELESAHTDAWADLNKKLASGAISKDKGYGSIGRMSVRMCVHILSKKNPFEDTKFADIQAIKAEFDNALNQENEQNPVALPSASSKQALDLKHVADPTWALEHMHGYEPGQLFILKDFKGVFKLTHFQHGRSCFEEVVLQGQPFRIEFEVELARKSASKFKGTLPAHVIVESFLPATSDYMTHALDRCHVFSALVKASVAHGGDSSLFFP
jgi:hypothetical protein